MIDLIFDLQRFAGNNIAISLTGGGSYPSTSLGGSSNHINAGNGAHTVNVSLGGDSGFDYDYELWIDNFDTDDEILFQNASVSIGNNNDKIYTLPGGGVSFKVYEDGSEKNVSIYGANFSEWAVNRNESSTELKFSTVSLSATNNNEDYTKGKIRYDTNGTSLFGLSGSLSNVGGVSTTPSLFRYSSLSNSIGGITASTTIIIPKSLLATPSSTPADNQHVNVLTLKNADGNNYSLSLGAGYTDSIRGLGISWAASVGSESTYTYYSEYMSKGWSLGSSSTIDYYGYSLGGESFTISGLTSGLNTSTDSDGKYATPAGVTVSSKNVSLDTAALANQDVSISGDYKLYLGDAALSTASLGAGWSLSPADIFVYHTSGGYSAAG